MLTAMICEASFTLHSTCSTKQHGISVLQERGTFQDGKLVVWELMMCEVRHLGCRKEPWEVEPSFGLWSMLIGTHRLKSADR